MEELACAPAEHPAEKNRLQHHQGAGAAELGQRSGDLAADERTTDHHHALARGVLTDGIAVADRAQVVDALQVAPGDVQAPHVGARGQQPLVKAELVSAGELHPPLTWVDRHGRDLALDLDALLVVPLGRARQDLLPRLLPAEVVLGQIGPVVREIGLARDHHNLALGPLLP